MRPNWNWRKSARNNCTPPRNNAVTNNCKPCRRRVFRFAAFQESRPWPKRNQLMGKPVKVSVIRQPHADEIIFADKFARIEPGTRTPRRAFHSRFAMGGNRARRTRESSGTGLIGHIIGRCTLAACVAVEDLDEIRDAMFDRHETASEAKPVAERLQPLLDLAIAEQWEAGQFQPACDTAQSVSFSPTGNHWPSRFPLLENSMCGRSSFLKTFLETRTDCRNNTETPSRCTSDRVLLLFAPGTSATRKPR